MADQNSNNKPNQPDGPVPEGSGAPPAKSDPELEISPDDLVTSAQEDPQADAPGTPNPASDNLVTSDGSNASNNSDPFPATDDLPTSASDYRENSLATSYADSGSQNGGSGSADKKVAKALEGKNTPPVEEVIGTKIGGHYKVVGLLGEGGMGRVYLAEDEGLGRKVALKRLLVNGDGVTPEALARFYREAKTIAKFVHPNITVIYHQNVDEEGPYIVMEYVDGGCVSDLLKAKEPVEPQVIAQFIYPIAEALDFAHARNVIHRDIKPSNILLTEDGIPKLADFGLAKDVSDSQMMISKPNARVGTWAYMAPEQFEGAEKVCPGSDTYALAKTTWHLLTGRVPTTIDYDMVAFEYREIFRKAMAEKPEDRHSTVTEFAAAFRDAAIGSSATPTLPEAESKIRCTACGCMNDPDARYCGDCGAALQQTCPKCAAVLPIDLKHCSSCGTNIAAFKKAKILTQKAREAFENRRYDEAHKIVSSIEDSGYLTDEAKNVRSKVHEIKQKIGTGREKLNSMIASHQYDEALSLAERLAQIDPNNQSHSEIKSEIIEAKTQFQADRLVARVEKLLSKNQFDQALPVLREIKNVAPKHARLQSLINQMQQQEANYKTAIRTISELHQNQQLDEALDRLRALDQEFPDQAETKKRIQKYEREQSKLKQALEQANRMKEQGSIADQIKAWQYVVSLDPSHPQALFQLQQLDEATTAAKGKSRWIAMAWLVIVLMVLVCGGLAGYHFAVIEPWTQEIDGYLDKANNELKAGDIEAVKFTKSKAAEMLAGAGLIPSFRLEPRRQRLDQLNIDVIEAGLKQRIADMTAIFAQPARAEGMQSDLAAELKSIRDIADEHNIRIATVDEVAQPILERAKQDEAELRFDRALSRYEMLRNIWDDSNLFKAQVDQLSNRLNRQDAVSESRQQYRAARTNMRNQTVDPEKTRLWEVAQQIAADAEQSAENGNFDQARDQFAQAIASLDGIPSEVEQRQTALDAQRAMQIAYSSNDIEVASSLLDNVIANAIALGEQADQAIVEFNYNQAVTAYARAQEQFQWMGQAQPMIEQLDRTLPQFDQATDAAQNRMDQWFAAERFTADNDLNADWLSLFDEANQTRNALTSLLENALNENTLPQLEQINQRLAMLHDQLPDAERLTLLKHLASNAPTRQGLQLNPLYDLNFNQLSQANRRTFTPGSPNTPTLQSLGRDDILEARPAQPLTIDRPSLLSLHETTNALFKQFVEATGYQTTAEKTSARQNWQTPGFDLPADEQPQHPVVHVSYQDAQAFLDWLNDELDTAAYGWSFRLPTEVEWEFAARSNQPNTAPYSWGSFEAGVKNARPGNVRLNSQDASYFEAYPNANRPNPRSRRLDKDITWNDGYPYTAPVGKFDARSAYHDLHGNVAEWTDSRFYKVIHDPSSAAPGSNTALHTIRGGAWNELPGESRITRRLGLPPETHSEGIGFRLTLDLNSD